MSIDLSRLQPLGWSNFFTTQIPLAQLGSVRPARVVRVERGCWFVDSGLEAFPATLAGRLHHLHADTHYVTVGDWVLLAADAPVIVERLDRRSLIERREAGGIDAQPLAANIDLMLVVSGLDGEFNLHRVERYLVLAAQADVLPLVLLTKADLADDPERTAERVRRRLPAGADVLAVDALRDPLAERLSPWLEPGTSLVVVGSSGVGKSTVTNNLAGQPLQETRATRRDAKGRHTTTSRSLIRLPGGACMIDVPGIREVGLVAEEGVDRQFSSIAELARACRFVDCTHQAEPGCAVRAAVERGAVDPDAWAHYLKLLAEGRHSLAEHERRRRDRVFGKMVKATVAAKKRDHGR
ncbi:ribosome small subunit-dependent GTPase A [Thioalkalicoccus limnaeus]|uniref:Small ribosomal subunit biogenesis GTPase RsgA n=1 Tax=Thioalkalicoccus limnaeus TaxID=120681 RepID=A0ABV4BMX2_9GAMM